MTSEVQTEYTYSPFGATTESGVQSSNPYRFTGREWEPMGTGMYFMRERYMMPLWGRFLSRDPMGFAAGSTNLYTYAGNSPTNFTDPLGTFAAYSGLSGLGATDTSSALRIISGRFGVAGGGSLFAQGIGAFGEDVRDPFSGFTGGAIQGLEIATLGGPGLISGSGIGGLSGGSILVGGKPPAEMRKAPAPPKQPTGPEAFFLCGGSFTAFNLPLLAGCGVALGSCASGAGAFTCGVAAVPCATYLGGIGACVGAAYPKSRFGPPSKRLLPKTP